MATSPNSSSLTASLVSRVEPFLAAVRRWIEPPLAIVRRAPLLAALLGMAVLGFAISVYLTTVHYAGVALVCSTGGIVNCARVTSSPYSVIPGTQIPITIPGMLWFAVSGALAGVGLVALERGQREPERLRLAHVVWGGLGLAFVFYLVYAEIVKLHQICEWCTAVHLLTLFTFFVALYRLQQQMTGEDGAGRIAPARTPARSGAVRNRPSNPPSNHAADSVRTGATNGARMASRGPGASVATSAPSRITSARRAPSRPGAAGRGQSSRRKR